MKFVSAAASLLLAATGISAANAAEQGSVHFIDNILTPEEAYGYIASTEMVDPVPTDHQAKFRGKVKVGHALQNRLKSALNSEFVPSDNDCDADNDIMLQTRLLYKTTKQHVDVYADNEAGRMIGAGKTVDDHVAFVFLTDNDQAEFTSGGITIPAVAGRLVTFPGNAMHGTTLNKGTVNLLGPFSIKNFASVENPPTTCASGKRCYPTVLIDPVIVENDPGECPDENYLCGPSADPAIWCGINEGEACVDESDVCNGAGKECVDGCSEGESLVSTCVSNPCNVPCDEGDSNGTPDRVKICIQNGLPNPRGPGGQLRPNGPPATAFVELCVPTVAAQTLIAVGNAECGMCEPV